MKIVTKAMPLPYLCDMKSFSPGQYIKQAGYRAFMPNPINRAWLMDDPELLVKLSTADRQLGRLDMFSEYVPNIDMFIQMHIAKEAAQSSKIEGTQTSIEEVVLDVDDVAQEKRDDWREVHNYIDAMNAALADLAELPLSSRLLRRTHAALMQGLRGESKQPGEFRTSQNWIGGSSPSDAAFVPPPHTEVNWLMGDLESFLHNDEFDLPPLIRIAIAHYQFETIHPFLDGNGRIGRLMITLFLVEQRVLKQPVLYLSDFLERNRSAYYDCLTAVRDRGDLRRWIMFFLNGVIETSTIGIETFDSILKLQREVDQRLGVLKARAATARTLMEGLYRSPVLDAQRAAELSGLSKPAVYRLIASLEELGILKEVSGGTRGRLYIFSQYLSLFQSRT